MNNYERLAEQYSRRIEWCECVVMVHIVLLMFVVASFLVTLELNLAFLLATGINAGAIYLWMKGIKMLDNKRKIVYATLEQRH